LVFNGTPTHKGPLCVGVPLNTNQSIKHVIFQYWCVAAAGLFSRISASRGCVLVDDRIFEHKLFISL